MMLDWGSARCAGGATRAALVIAMLVSGCGHAGPSVRQSMTSTAADTGAARTLAVERAETEEIASSFDLDKPEVEPHVEAFRTRLRGFFDRALWRGARYLPTMSDILEREGLPPELVYLPLIESGYQLHAVSRAGATGPWQFISATGRRYGLRIDSLVDERRDPIKSTKAAVQYLKDLHELFGDWELSLAAYNSGEYRVARVLERDSAQDFWDLRRRGSLPRETRDYVPRFLAAVRIASAPHEYGFEAPPALAKERYETVYVSKQVSLRTAAALCGASASELAALNPALRQGITPSGYSIRVPVGKAAPLRSALARYTEPARPTRAVASAAKRTPPQGQRRSTVAKGAPAKRPQAGAARAPARKVASKPPPKPAVRRR